MHRPFVKAAICFTLILGYPPQGDADSPARQCNIALLPFEPKTQMGILASYRLPDELNSTLATTMGKSLTLLEDDPARLEKIRKIIAESNSGEFQKEIQIGKLATVDFLVYIELSIKSTGISSIQPAAWHESRDTDLCTTRTTIHITLKALNVSTRQLIVEGAHPSVDEYTKKRRCDGSSSDYYVRLESSKTLEQIYALLDTLGTKLSSKLQCREAN